MFIFVVAYIKEKKFHCCDLCVQKKSFYVLMIKSFVAYGNMHFLNRGCSSTKRIELYSQPAMLEIRNDFIRQETQNYDHVNKAITLGHLVIFKLFKFVRTCF